MHALIMHSLSALVLHLSLKTITPLSKEVFCIRRHIHASKGRRKVPRNVKVSQLASVQYPAAAEVRGLLINARSQVKALLTEQLEQLHSVAAALLDHETLTAGQIKVRRLRVVCGNWMTECSNKLCVVCSHMTPALVGGCLCV
jgi:hypothetical protein